MREGGTVDGATSLPRLEEHSHEDSRIEFSKKLTQALAETESVPDRINASFDQTRNRGETQH